MTIITALTARPRQGSVKFISILLTDLEHIIGVLELIYIHIKPCVDTLSVAMFVIFRSDLVYRLFLELFWVMT